MMNEYWKCPFYNKTGICSFGCTDEPRCVTCEPENGWDRQRQHWEKLEAVAPDITELYNMGLDGKYKVTVDDITTALHWVNDDQEVDVHGLIEALVDKVFKDRLKIIAQSAVIKGLRSNEKYIEEKLTEKGITIE